MMPTIPPAPVVEALKEAARWRLLSLLLERPRPGWHEETEALARETGDTDLREIAAKARNATEGEYLSVLGPGRQVSPRQVSYRPQDDPGRLLSELNAFYDAFVYRPRTEDPPDHLSVETGFLGYLHLKRAYAQAEEDAESVANVEKARKDFIDRHLRSFVHAFDLRMAENDDGYLRETARRLREMVGT